MLAHGEFEHGETERDTIRGWIARGFGDWQRPVSPAPKVIETIKNAFSIRLSERRNFGGTTVPPQRDGMTFSIRGRCLGRAIRVGGGQLLCDWRPSHVSETPSFRRSNASRPKQRARSKAVSEGVGITHEVQISANTRHRLAGARCMRWDGSWRAESAAGRLSLTPTACPPKGRHDRGFSQVMSGGSITFRN